MWETISFLLEKNGISLYKCEQDCHLANGTLGKLRAGKNKCLSPKALQRLAAYFGVTVDFLLTK